MFSSQLSESSEFRQAQDLAHIVNIVVSGGGAAGICFAGSFKRIEGVRGFSFSHIRRAAGSSIGSVAALAICLGLNPERMFTKLATLDFKKFLDRSSKSKIIYNFFKHRAVSEGREITQELLQFLKEETDRINNDLKQPLDLPAPERLTFRDLKKLGCKDLFIVTTECFMRGNEGGSEQKIWCHLTTPDAPVAAVILASMAVPVLFPGVTFKQDEDKIFSVIPNSTHDPFAMLNFDGGITNNCLLKLFDYRCYLNDGEIERHEDDKESMKFLAEIADFEKPDFGFDPDLRVKNPHTLAFALYPSSDIPKTPIIGYNPLAIGQAIINGFLLSRLNELLRDNHERIIVVNSPIAMTDFDANEELQQQAILAGARAVSRYLGLTDAINEEEYKLPRKYPTNPAPHPAHSVPALSAAECFLMWGSVTFTENPPSPATPPAEKARRPALHK
ncbi:hypothetical protein AQUSIP_02480 [Aquicella siphonis]|uniref:PNPLA domain-containing protein n=1 Tax=Aquicella siphonis TaxID=254247 RepID=A0A5E4PDV2_9COXI|nr:patatin-like phospholipase family protein [Aquicella siphonis]VVC74974.1 hypothetical protein AQUSIP_02480 [Aquicella siphonis]